MEPINTLSTFNGMGCIWYALKRAGIPMGKCYSSEIDKYATQANDAAFNDTIQVGDVTKWREWNIDWSTIDLFVGGSPCQGFSFAGKQLNFEDPRSKLFFEFVAIWNHIKKHNPDAKFLLENVNMKKEHLRVISEYMGVFPVRINSNLVSAQNRDRWYWSNIRTKETGLFSELWTDIPQPKDKGILLKDILQPESEVDEKYYISNKALARIDRKNYSKPKINPDKAGTLNTKNNSGQLSIDSGTTLIRGIDTNGKAPTQRSSTGRCLDDKHNYQIIKIDKQGNKKADQSKAGCLTAGGNSGGNNSDMDIICVSMVGRKLDENGVRKDNDPNIKAVQQLEPNTDNKTNCLTTVAKDNLLTDGYKLRRLTVRECGKLQTFTDAELDVLLNAGISDSQLYKMFGNGWTVDAIAHILSFMK